MEESWKCIVRKKKKQDHQVEIYQNERILLYIFMYNMKDTNLALDVMRFAKNFSKEEDTRISAWIYDTA